MTQVTVIPDTNFFIDNPDFAEQLKDPFLDTEVLLCRPVLSELDQIRKERWSGEHVRADKARMAFDSIEEHVRLRRRSLGSISVRIDQQQISYQGNTDERVAWFATDIARRDPSALVVFISNDQYVQLNA
jgi:predicted ribonuclease YlaK